MKLKKISLFGRTKALVERYRRISPQAFAALSPFGVDATSGNDKAKIIAIDPMDPTAKPTRLSLSEFIDGWSGQVVLVSRSSGEAAKDRAFDWKWFLPELYRFKGIMAVTFLISLILHGTALAPTEALILGGLSSENALPARLERDWSIDTAPDCYAVPRGAANFWFLITGRRSPEIFAKLCGVDLRPRKFPIGKIVQTSVARSCGIIIRADLGAVPAFHLLGDSASALYMFDCFEDAMEEFGGKNVGISAVNREIGS